jgi:hypothetical protein
MPASQLQEVLFFASPPKMQDKFPMLLDKTHADICFLPSSIPSRFIPRYGTPCAAAREADGFPERTGIYLRVSLRKENSSEVHRRRKEKKKKQKDKTPRDMLEEASDNPPSLSWKKKKFLV